MFHIRKRAEKYALKQSVASTNTSSAIELGRFMHEHYLCVHSKSIDLMLDL